MASKTRNKVQRKVQRAEMMQLISRGVPKWKIAEKFKVTQAQISYDFKLVMKQIVEETTTITKELIAVKLAQYAEIAKEAWEAWEKSKIGYDDEGNRIYCNPNTNYIRLVLECLEAERELQNLNPAKEVSIQGQVNWEVFVGGIPDGSVPEVIEHEIAKAMIESAEPKQLLMEIPNGAANGVQRESDNGRNKGPEHTEEQKHE